MAAATQRSVVSAPHTPSLVPARFRGGHRLPVGHRADRRATHSRTAAGGLRLPGFDQLSEGGAAGVPGFITAEFFNPASNAERHPPRKRALTRRKRIRFTDTRGTCQIPELGSSIHKIGFEVQYASRKRVHLPLSRRESDLYFGLNASVGMNNP